MIYAKRSAYSLTRTGVGRHRLCLACRQPSHLLRHHRRHLSATRQRLWSTLFVPDEMAAPGQSSLPPKLAQIPGMPVVMRCLQCLVVFRYQFVIFMLLFSSWVKKSLCRWQKCPCARVEYIRCDGLLPAPGVGVLRTSSMNGPVRLHCIS